MIKNNFRHTQYACYLGYVTQAIVNNFAPLLFLIFQKEFEISLDKITLLITVNFCTQLTVDFIFAKLADKIGYRPCIMAAHIFSAAGLAGLAVFPDIFPSHFSGLLFAVILYAVGGGIIEVLISPIAEACPTENKAAVMSLLHSFYCWGSFAVVLISTLFLFAAGKENWRILAIFWAIVPLTNTFYFSKVPIAKLTEDGEGMGIIQLFSEKTFWIFVILIIASGASELAMSQWASAFAESGLNVSKTIGDLTGACLFSLLMGSARLFYAKYGHKVDLLTFITGSGILCVIAYLTAVLNPIPAVSLIGCGLCGLSVGVLWPGVFSIASARYPKGGTAMFALLALAGDLGCSSGPTLVGFVSKACGDNLKTGLTAAVIFPAIIIVFSIIYGKMRKTTSHPTQ